MSFFNRLIAVILSAALIAPVVPLEARTRKGDKYLAEGRIHETRKEWDAALESYEKALSEDPADSIYQMAVQKTRFQTSSMHLDAGLKIRAKGQLGDALIEFQKAYAVNPGSVVASQEIQLTTQMIDREAKRVQETGKEAPPAERALTPVEQMKKAEMNKIDRILGVPELKPLNPAPLNLRIAGQKTKTVYETIAKLAGINIVWDPDYQPPGKDQINVDLENESLERALDIVDTETKSYYKALSPNTIFITNDNANKRRDYEEQVTKVFYLQNVSTPAELQEIVNVVRTAADINRVFPYNAQFALVVRGEADRVELAGKLIHDLDKPKSEVLVDILVIESSSTFSKQITAAIASTGLNLPVSFSPRSSIQSTTANSTTNSSTTNNGTNNGITPTTTSSTTGGSYIPLSNLKHISSSDFATTLPSALLQAAMSDAKTKVLQAPQLRAVDNMKASLKIGEREPTASGSFQPGVGGIGVNPLVNTQFTYIDVGVNVDMTARVHDNNEVSMEITLEISNITGQVNLGGINQPVIGQRKVTCNLRMKEGEVALLGGLINQEDDTTVTGIPGLSSIPLLGKLFSGNSMNHNRDELMIVLVPHILRRPEITTENIRPIAVGNATVIQLHHAPKGSDATVVADNTPAAAPATPVAPAVPAAPPLTQPVAPAGPPAAAPATQPNGPLPPATAPPLPPGMAPMPTGAAAPAAAAQPAPGATLRFNPATMSVTQGSAVSVSLEIDGGTDVAAAPMQIRFDPKILQLSAVTPGDFLSSDGQQPIFAKNVMNESGQASIQLSRLPGSAGVTAPSGTSGYLEFPGRRKRQHGGHRSQPHGT